MSDVSHRVTILGDSRVFDTYYASAIYGRTAYGYHQTFPHHLQRRLSGPGGIDCVHIPDHFRGRTLQNNILRLALTDPTVVVLCDGIWESLLSRKHFLEFVERSITADGANVAFEYSPDAIVGLYEQNQLSLSPSAYAARVATLTSWFVRRRRKVVWLTTPIPPVGHKGGIHYAGNYRPFPGWHRCLEILNSAASAAVLDAGGAILDLHALMLQSGGAERCLIDQWHFSTEFHSIVAGRLEALVRASVEGFLPPAFSSRVMVQGALSSFATHLIGSPHACRAFTSQFPDVSILSESATIPSPASLTAGLDALVVVEPDPALRRQLTAAALHAAPPTITILYPEDLAPLDNPAVSDRSSFGTFK